MTVPPASQLTRRIVPASTLRRNDATIIGSTTSTPNTTAAIRMSEFIRGRVKGDIRSPFGNPNGAAMSCGVDARDANQIARANARAARAIFCGEGGEQLYDLAV